MYAAFFLSSRSGRDVHKAHAVRFVFPREAGQDSVLLAVGNALRRHVRHQRLVGVRNVRERIADRDHGAFLGRLCVYRSDFFRKSALPYASESLSAYLSYCSTSRKRMIFLAPVSVLSQAMYGFSNSPAGRIAM